tara:strand:+ start:428 stop:757 length:330 start_codon:yes stop_codon:yes gene_type:complete
MDFQQIALDVFNNKEHYKDNDFIVILNILMESYNKAKGVPYENNIDLKQETIDSICSNCSYDVSEAAEDELIDNLCINCYEDLERCDSCSEYTILDTHHLCSDCSDLYS